MEKKKKTLVCDREVEAHRGSEVKGVTLKTMRHPFDQQMQGI